MTGLHGGYDPQHSILTGLDQPTLQRMLAQAQQAYFDLSTGGKLETVAYTQGDGSKSVTYTRAQLGNITQLILQLQAQLGLRRVGRRPFRFVIR